jgi:subfamily B ATP-binding cassette protein MsbA
LSVIGRLFRYLRLAKSKAIASIALAAVVALLASAQIPALIPLFKVLFAPEDRSILSWPDKLPDFLGRLREPLRSFLENQVLADPFGTLVWALGILVALNLVKGVAAFYQEYTAGKVHTTVSRRLAADLYNHVLGLSMSFYNRVGSPNIVSRFTNDIEAVGRGLALLFGKLLLEPLLVIGYLFWACVINWKLLLFNLALFPLLAIGIHALGLRAKRAMRRGLFGRDRLLGILQETVEGIPIVKAFNMEEHEEGRFREENETVRRQDLKVVKADAFVSPFVEFLGILAVGLSLLIAGDMVIKKQMKPEMFSAFYFALAAMFAPIRKLSNVNNRIQVLIAAATRVFEFMDTRPDVAEKPAAKGLAPFSREIRFENVSFTYNGSDMVLHGVSLTAARGEIVALVGPSGAGKTTIVRLIPRFYDPAAGAVTIDAADLRDVTLASLRDQIGLVTQEVILFNDTIAANISYGKPSAARDEIVAAARRANAHEFIERLPQGYDSMIGEKGLVLSGGQRQRIALARAILKDPPILILDEATSSLDSESEHLIQQSLDEFMQHRTSIVIAHRLSTVQRASRIYFVDAGRIIAAGTNNELLASCPAYKNLYSRQFQLASV